MGKHWWESINFDKKLPVLIVVLPLIGFMIFSTFIHTNHYQQIKKRQHRESSRILTLHENFINMIVQHALDKLFLITKTPIVIQSVSWTNQRFANLNKSQKTETGLNEDVSKFIDLTISEPSKTFIRNELESVFSDIVITEQNGFNIWGDYISIPFDQRESTWWFQAITNDFWIGDFQTNFEQGEITLPIACAIKDESSDNIGVLKANFRLEFALTSQIKDFLPANYLMILNDDTFTHTIILPQISAKLKKQLLVIKEFVVNKNLTESEFELKTNGNSTAYNILTKQVKPERLAVNWHLGILVPQEINFISGLVSFSLIPTIIAFVLLISAYFVIQRTFIIPLQEIYDQVDAVATGNYRSRINLDDAFELRPLAQHLNYLFELLQNFARTKLDSQTIKTHITRLLAVIKSMENNNFNSVLPVIDNEWGVLNSEFNILNQQLLSQHNNIKKHLDQLKMMWESQINHIAEVSKLRQQKDDRWREVIVKSIEELNHYRQLTESVKSQFNAMQDEIKNLQEIVYSISNDLQIVKYHIRHFDQSIQETLSAQDNWDKLNNRLKDLAVKSSEIAQKSGKLKSSNGFSSTVTQWSNETIGLIVDYNERASKLNSLLTKLEAVIGERPKFSQYSLESYKTMEKNIETLTNLINQTNDLLNNIGKTHESLLIQINSSQTNIDSHDITYCFLDENILKSYNDELNSLKQLL